jgi:hypothetical protein
MLITMSNAPGVDFRRSVRSGLPGPDPLSPNLPTVIELVQVEDFEATLGWVMRIRGPRSRPPPRS